MNNIFKFTISLCILYSCKGDPVKIDRSKLATFNGNLYYKEVIKLAHHDSSSIAYIYVEDLSIYYIDSSRNSTLKKFVCNYAKTNKLDIKSNQKMHIYLYDKYYPKFEDVNSRDPQVKTKIILTKDSTNIVEFKINNVK